MKLKTKIVILLACLSISSCSEYVTQETFEDGTVKLKCQVKNGTKHGQCIQYYPNGKIEYESHYKSGVLNGISKFLYANGVLHWKVDFVDGVKEGRINYFDSLGVIYQSSEFSENQLHGISYEYYSNGNVKTKATYHKNLLNGEFISYFETGDLKRTNIYSSGDLMDFKEYNISGDLIGKYINYEIAHEFKTDNTVVIKMKIIDPLHDKHMLDVLDFESNTDTVRLLKDRIYSEDSNLEYTFKWPIDTKEISFKGVFYEVQRTENAGKVVVTSIREFEYPIKIEVLPSS